jgi:predicted nucleic acid-binding protein
MRHGLDTGFLVAFEAADHSHHTASHALVRQCLSNGDDFALAPQVLAELVHVLNRTSLTLGREPTPRTHRCPPAP